MVHLDVSSTRSLCSSSIDGLSKTRDSSSTTSFPSMIVTLGALERIGGVCVAVGDAVSSDLTLLLMPKYLDARSLEQPTDIGRPFSGFLVTSSESVIDDCARFVGPSSLQDLLENEDDI